MTDLIQALSGSFVIANLGAGGDTDYNLPDHFLNAITLIELDIGDQPISSRAKYYAKYRIKDVIAGSTTPRTFTQRAYWGSSSLLAINTKVTQKYGLESPFETESTLQVNPITLPELLICLDLSHLDFLKTDLEGIDFEVIQSLTNLFDRILFIQCELLFEPIYQGAPNFYEVVRYLYERDFELIGLKPEFWKPQTRHRSMHRDGVLAWADCLFVKKSEALFKLPSNELPLAQAKQIIISAMLGKKCYAEWLLQIYQNSLPTEWLVGLQNLVTPNRDSKLIYQQLKASAIDVLFVTPLWPLLRMLRRKTHRNAVYLFEHVARVKDNIA